MYDARRMGVECAQMEGERDTVPPLWRSGEEDGTTISKSNCMPWPSARQAVQAGWMSCSNN